MATSSRPVSGRPVARKVVTVDSQSPLSTVGFFATMLYLFGMFGLTEELALTFLGFRFYITAWAPLIAVLAALFSGGIGRVFRYKPALLLLGFTAWMLICVPFSTYRRGSFDVVSGYLNRNLLVMFLVMITVTQWRHIKAAFYTIAAATFIIVVAAQSSRFANAAEDRLALGTEGRLGNPNDMATHLIVLLIFCGGLFFISNRFSLIKPGSALLTMGCLFTIFRTGSRGAVITLIALGALLLWKMPSMIQRITLGLGTCVLVVLLIPFLPSSITQRYALMFSDEEIVPESAMEAHALDSSESRKRILRRSIQMTFQNPLFGVGPGEFANAENAVSKEEGGRGTWLQTHNSYTQTSSETGLPGFLLFLTTIITGALSGSRWYHRLYRLPGLRHHAIAALVMFLALSCFAINITFSSLAYTYYIPALVGLLGSLHLIALEEMAKLPKPAKAVSNPFTSQSPLAKKFS